MTEEIFGGIKINGVAYCVGRLPYRKKIQLYRDEGVWITPIAWFAKDEDAKAFLDWLLLLAPQAKKE